MRRFLSYWPLILITLLGAALRLFRFDSVPLSLNWDEVSHGYNAYSILKTGMDEWGTKLPLIFRAYGDYKLPVYIYLTAIPVWLFGLSAFSVRLISVLAGILAIPGIYLLSNRLFGHLNLKIKNLFGIWNLEFGILPAVMLALSPWHFFISRPALEANLALTLFIYGLYFLLKFNFIPAAIFLGLTLHTYNTYRVLTPLIICLFILINKNSIFSPPKLGGVPRRGEGVLGCLIFAVFLLPLFFQIYSGTGLARYDKLSILNENSIYQIGQQRLSSNLPSILPRLIHNRPVYFAQVFLLNYSGYFSPWFFYQVEGVQSQFAVPSKNMITLPVLALAVAGLFICLFNLKKRAYFFILTLLLVAPIAAALTLDPPQALRPTPMLIPLILLASLAFYNLLKLIRGLTPKWPWITSVLIVYFIGILSFSFYRYAFAYFTDYSTRYATSWQYGYQQVMDYVKNNQAKYDQVFITKKLGEPHEFFAFFTGLNPKIIQSPNQTIRFFQSGWYWTDKIQNIYFVNDWEIPNQVEANTLTLESKNQLSTKNSLLITSVMHQPKNTTKLETIYTPDQTPIFIISKFND